MRFGQLPPLDHRMLGPVRDSATPNRAVLAGEPLFVRLRQVCTVVDDFERTLRNLIDHLGIGPFRCWELRPPRLYGTTFRGRPAAWSMKVGITWLDDIQWEVIQPLDGSSLYREHLDARRPGVHHVVMDTGAVPFGAAAARLALQGHPFAQTGFVNARIVRFTLPTTRLMRPFSLHFGYLDTQKTLHTSLELIRYPLGLSERFSIRSGSPDCYVPHDNSRFEDTLPNLGVGRLVKMGIVTRDLDATARHWINLGVHPWHVFDLNPGRLRRVSVGGATAAFSARVGWALIDDVLLELVQPMSGENPFQTLLDTQGESLAWLGVTPRSGFREIVNRCEGFGYVTRMEGALLGTHPAALLEARTWIGTDLEVLAPEGGIPSLFASLKPDRIMGTAPDRAP